MDIQTELRGRTDALYALLERRGLDGALFVGNSAVGTPAYGCFRYFTDHRVYYHLQALVIRPGFRPTVCCGSILHLDGLHARGFEDIRVNADILGSVCEILSEKKLPRLGVTLDMDKFARYAEANRKAGLREGYEKDPGRPADWCPKKFQW